MDCPRRLNCHEHNFVELLELEVEHKQRGRGKKNNIQIRH